MFGWVELCSHMHCVGWIFWLECPWYFLCSACAGLVRKGRKCLNNREPTWVLKPKCRVIGDDLAWLLVLLGIVILRPYIEHISSYTRFWALRLSLPNIVFNTS
jgi:hypothetical protein